MFAPTVNHDLELAQAISLGRMTPLQEAQTISLGIVKDISHPAELLLNKSEPTDIPNEEIISIPSDSTPSYSLPSSNSTNSNPLPHLVSTPKDKTESEPETETETETETESEPITTTEIPTPEEEQLMILNTTSNKISKTCNHIFRSNNLNLVLAGRMSNKAKERIEDLLDNWYYLVN